MNSTSSTASAAPASAAVPAVPLRELTLRAVVLGGLITLVFTAADVFRKT